MHAIPVHDWWLAAIFGGGLVSLIAGTEWLIQTQSWNAQTGRNVLHLSIGLVVLPTPFLFSSPAPLLGMAVVFAVVNTLALSANSPRSLASGERQSLGTVFFPLAFALVVWLFWEEKAVIVVALAALAVSDVLGSVVGRAQRQPHRIRISPEEKSVEGSVAVFGSTSVLAAVGLTLLAKVPDFTFGHIVLAAVAIGLCVTAAEVVSVRGSDNLSVPLVAAMVASLSLRNGTDGLAALLLGMALALVLALLSVRWRFLDPGGAVVLFLMGTLIFAAGAWPFALPIVLFFLSSSLLSRLGRGRKRGLQGIFEKTGRRDAGQVLANGLLPMIFVGGWYLQPDPVWYLLYLAALAAVTADTWATEIGVLSPWPPWSIRNGRRVPPGTSGGVTTIGLTAALLGAVMIAAVAQVALPGLLVSSAVLVVVAASGFLAHLVDSWLGASLQAQFHCQHCGQQTERRFHCGPDEASLVRGRSWITNDLVNAACAASGSVLFLLLWPIVRLPSGLPSA